MLHSHIPCDRRLYDRDLRPVRCRGRAHCSCRPRRTCNYSFNAIPHYPCCHERSSCLTIIRLFIRLFQTTSELRRKYSEYLDHHGYEQSLLSTTAFDAIWVAAKTLNASIERLQPNETIDQFSYDNSRMTKIFFDSLTKLQFEGASVSCGVQHVNAIRHFSAYYMIFLDTHNRSENVPLKSIHPMLK